MVSEKKKTLDSFIQSEKKKKNKAGGNSINTSFEYNSLSPKKRGSAMTIMGESKSPDGK